MQEGTVTSIDGDGVANIGLPPHTTNEQWVALITFFQANQAPVAGFSIQQPQTSLQPLPIQVRTMGPSPYGVGTSGMAARLPIRVRHNRICCGIGNYSVSLMVTDNTGATGEQSFKMYPLLSTMKTLWLLLRLARLT